MHARDGIGAHDRVDLAYGGQTAAVIDLVRHCGLMAVTDAMLKWAAGQGLTWDKTSDPDGTEHWGSRLELYNTNPVEEPDMNNWDTDLQFRL